VTRTLTVAKYQASGNDFLVVDALDAPPPPVDVPALSIDGSGSAPTASSLWHGEARRRSRSR